VILGDWETKVKLRIHRFHLMKSGARASQFKKILVIQFWIVQIDWTDSKMSFVTEGTKFAIFIEKEEVFRSFTIPILAKAKTKY
jgi:hypothetical protein